MASKIDTVTARDALKPRIAPYFQKLRAGAHLGFRKTVPGSFGTWVVRFTNANGKYETESLGSLDSIQAHMRFDAATKAANELIVRKGSGGFAEHISVAEAFKRYIQKHRIDGRLSTVKDLEGRYRRWIEPHIQLANTKVANLTQEQVKKWRTTLSTTPATLQDRSKTGTKPRSPSSINREMAVFKAALNLALKEGHAASDTAWKYQLTPIKNATQRREHYLDIAERRLLIASAQEDLGNFIKALTLLPLRPGALAKLKVSDFDKRLGQVKVTKDKSAQNRSIELPVKTAEFLAQQAENKKSDDPLLSRADGKFWNKDSWKYPFKDAVKAAQLSSEVTAYTLRHTVITDLISVHGLDTVSVATLSGTSLAMIEKHYGHLLRSRATAALAGLAI